MIDQAIAEFQNSIRDQKLKVNSLFNLGLCFREKKLFDIAITQFTKALESSTLTTEGSKIIRYNLALVYEMNHNLDKALAEFKRLMEIDINYKDVNEHVERIQKMATGK
jgi:tetratricopeptide (TPR) repeat protein